MTNQTTNTPSHTAKTYTRDLGSGTRLQAAVSPCVFTCPGYPLQLRVELYCSDVWMGDVRAVDRALTADTYTDEAVERLLATIGITPCSRCSAPAFDPATVETNRNGVCEGCFLSDLNAEFAAAEEAEQRKLAARDRRMKRKGMVVRVTAWVHPQGDDYQVDWYLAAHPTPEQVADMLRAEGSSCLDDYQITVL